MCDDVPFMGIFGRTSEMDVLQFLIAEPNSFYNITELSDIMEMHRDTISKIMDHFQSKNLVEFQPKGRAKCFRLNGNSKIVRGLDILVAGIVDETGPDMHLFESSVNAIHSCIVSPQGHGTSVTRIITANWGSLLETSDRKPSKEVAWGTTGVEVSAHGAYTEGVA